MGSCVSLHQRDSQSAMKLGLSVESKNQSLVVPSPVKQNSVTVNGQDHAVDAKSQRSLPHFRSDGSKDDAFFDSQPWLESDCEDDFLSVNGDFTPSRGSTPLHHRFSSGNPTVISKPPLDVPEPSPKKRLSELFKESLRHHQDGDYDDKSSEEESVVIENAEKTADGVLEAGKKPEKSVQCCLPRLRSSRSLSERKTKASLPNGTG